MRKPAGAVRCHIVENCLLLGWECQWVDKGGKEIAVSKLFKTEDEARAHAALAGFTRNIPLDDD